MNNNGSNRPKTKPIPHSGYFINESIRADQMRVISADGQNLGIMSRRQALSAAQEQSFDLVQIGEADGIVIARIMDFGKFLYGKKKQQSEAKKNQKVIQIKEVKLRPNIGDQDYRIKVNRAGEFLKDGMRVKFTLQFRGREATMMHEHGPKLFDRIRTDLEKMGFSSLVEESESKGAPVWSRTFYVK